MICPKCNKGNLRCLGTVTNFDENEIYRRRGCLLCNYTCYTVEYEVIYNKAFSKAYSRSSVEQQCRTRTGEKK